MSTPGPKVFCLMSLDGPAAPVPIDGMLGLGRAADNQIRFPESDAIVSNHHASLYLRAGRVFLKDLSSANGTWMGEARVAESELRVGQEFSLGRRGPRFRLIVGPAAGPATGDSAAPGAGTLAMGDATRAYVKAVGQGQATLGGWTSFDTLRQKKVLLWFQRRNKKQKRLAAVLGVFLALFAGLSLWLFLQVRDLKAQVALHRTLVEQLTPGMDPAKRHETVLRIREAEKELEGMRSKLKDYAIKGIYSNPLAVKFHQAAEGFGEKGFVLPDAFVETASRQYRDLMSAYGKKKLAQALGRKRGYDDLIGKELASAGLPPALVWLAMHESRFDPECTSPRGARGLWQLMPNLAGEFGLDVPVTWRLLPPGADPRTSPAEATKAGIGYLKKLFAQYRDPFLAMAAYNSGEPQLNSALRRMKAAPGAPEDGPDTARVDEAAIVDAAVAQVPDARLRSDYWYLQRMNLLPDETMEYVPKIVATMVAAQDIGG